MLRALAALVCLAVPVGAGAFDGLVVSDLPPGGDVTVPGEYPIRVPSKVDVLFSGVMQPQSITFVNGAADDSVVRIYANHEKATRTLNLKPGATAVYSFKSSKPVRVRVVTGDVKVSSIHPLKVQR